MALSPIPASVLDSSASLTQSEIKGYETLRRSDPQYYTDQRIQKMIFEKEHRDPAFKILVESALEASKGAAKSGRTQRGGLYNVGNTCWLNSILHLFFNPSSPYYDALQQKARDTETPIYQLRCQALLGILLLANTQPTDSGNEKLQSAIKRFVTDFYQNSPFTSEEFGHQQDAHEGQDYLISYLGLSKPDSLSFGTVSYGSESKYVHPTCTHESILILQHGEYAKKAASMQELVDRATMYIEKMESENQLEKPGGGHEDGQRVNFIALKGKLPKEVVLEAPRFKYNAKAQRREKDHTSLIFNEQIQVPLFSEDGKKLLALAHLQLKSVVCHSGSSANSGHYVTLKKQSDGKYTRYDDTEVSVNLPATKAKDIMKRDGYIASYALEKVAPPSASDIKRYPNVDTVLKIPEQAAAPAAEPRRSDSSTSSLDDELSEWVELSLEDLEESDEFVTPPSSPSTSPAPSVSKPLVPPVRLGLLDKFKALIKPTPKKAASAPASLAQAPTESSSTPQTDPSILQALSSPLPVGFASMKARTPTRIENISGKTEDLKTADLKTAVSVNKFFNSLTEDLEF